MNEYNEKFKQRVEIAAEKIPNRRQHYR